jgi:hypothetical protein
VVEAQKALDDLLNPSETAVMRRRSPVDAQEAADKAQGYVAGLKYPAPASNSRGRPGRYLVAKYERRG